MTENNHYRTSPPKWVDNMSYEQYVKEISVWRLLKCATALEEGPLVFHQLTGEAKAAADELTVEEIGSAEGLNLILKKLDKLYLTDKNQRIFVDLNAFEKFKRPGNMTMHNFIVEFERLHSKVQKFGCKYPDGVLAYKILVAANLSIKHEELIQATIQTGQWSYDSMKAQIQKVFSHISPITAQNDDKAIKLEPTFYANQDFTGYTDNQQYPDFSDGEENAAYNNMYERKEFSESNDIYYGNFRGYRGNQMNRKPFNPQFRNQQNMRNNSNNPSQNFRPQGKRYINVNISKLKDSYNPSPDVPNPKDDRGMHTTCRKCRSIYHWYQDCPHVQNSNTSQGSKVFFGNDSIDDEVYISLFQNSVQSTTDDLLCLVGETLNYAVLDSGCT